MKMSKAKGYIKMHKDELDKLQTMIKKYPKYEHPIEYYKIKDAIDDRIAKIHHLNRYVQYLEIVREENL